MSKNLLKLGLENLCLLCLGNSSHDGCLKKNKNSFRYSKNVLEEKKTNI